MQAIEFLLGQVEQCEAFTAFVAIQARAQSVVGSLWTLGDLEAATAFEIFYESIANGESVASALRETRIELAGRGAPAAAWAGLVALGDAGFAPVTPGPRNGSLVLGAAVLLIALVAAVLVHRTSSLSKVRPVH